MLGRALEERLAHVVIHEHILEPLWMSVDVPAEGGDGGRFGVPEAAAWREEGGLVRQSVICAVVVPVGKAYGRMAANVHYGARGPLLASLNMTIGTHLQSSPSVRFAHSSS